MELPTSNSKRNRISDAQKHILERFYGAGMVGTGRLYKDKVEKAVVETGLAKAQVEVGNLTIFYIFKNSGVNIYFYIY